MSRLRNWCFTTNNPSDEVKTHMLGLYDDSNNIEYLIYGEETGDGGTPHLQGYIQLKKQTRMLTVKALLTGEPHLEGAKGSPDQASEYCMKEDNYHQFGALKSKQGARNDIKKFQEAIKEGKEELDLCEEMPTMMAKYPRFHDRLRILYSKASKSFAPLEVLVFHGEPGSGKTRKAHEIDPDLYMINLYDGKGSPWFDGYTNEETILFDDYYGQCPYDLLLRLTDGYKFSVQKKGSSVWKQWKRVIFTSNQPSSSWYRETAALTRRITSETLLVVEEE